MTVLLPNFPAAHADHVTQFWPISLEVGRLLGAFLGKLLLS